MVAYGAFYNKKWEKWIIKKNMLHICGNSLLGCQSKKNWKPLSHAAHVSNVISTFIWLINNVCTNDIKSTYTFVKFHTCTNQIKVIIIYTKILSSKDCICCPS